MKTLITLSLALGLVVLSALPASAQRLLTTTTFSAAVSATDNVVNVTSSTGFVVGQFIFVDQEVMRITNLNGVAGTSTRISVQRGVEGRVAAHANAQRIIVTATAVDLHHTDPDYSQACTRGTGQAAVLPWINVTTAVIWTCGQVGGATVWSATQVQRITFNSIPTSF